MPMMNAMPHKRFPWIWYLLALLVIGALAFAPIGSVMLCGAIANAYGCKVDEVRYIRALLTATIMVSSFIHSV